MPIAGRASVAKLTGWLLERFAEVRIPIPCLDCFPHYPKQDLGDTV